MVRIGRRIRRNRRGEFELRFPPQEKDMLRSLPDQLLEVLDGEPGDPELRRLFPPAYRNDDEAEAEYRSLMGSELLEHHREALRVMSASIDLPRLDLEQMTAWLTGLNELRLVLGTRLDVTEDHVQPAAGDPQAPAHALYGYLTWLQQQAVEVLAEAL